MALLSVSSVMHTVLTVLLAILILLVMITVHEFGHYLAGKALKFKINEFAIGFGPKLFKRVSKRTGEAFSVRLLPLGGFCAFEGEEGESKVLHPDAFINKAPWKRIIVLISGPLMNYLLALFLIIISMFSFGQMMFKVGSVTPADGDFAKYSLCADDVIYDVDGKGIYILTDLVYALDGKSEGDIVKMTVFRDGERQTVEVMLRTDCDFKNSEDTGRVFHALGLGTYLNDGASYWDCSFVSTRFGFFETLGRSFLYSFKVAGTIFRVLGELLTGRMGISSMGGPVTTIMVTSEVAAQSLQSFFEISAYIGVNLAIFNLLPIPALDGSKVIFCLIEWIFRKPVPRKVEAIIHSVGFIAILAFAVLVDILQFV